MPVQTRSMLKNASNNLTPIKRPSTKLPNAPKKQKSSNNLTIIQPQDDTLESLINHCLKYNSPEQNNDNLNELVEPSSPISSPIPIYRKKLNIDYSYVSNLMDKIVSTEDNEKYEHYLELCEYHIKEFANCLKNCYYNKRAMTMKKDDISYIELVQSKCCEFERSCKEGGYDDLRYGLIVKCSRCNLHLEFVCRELLLKA